MATHFSFEIFGALGGIIQQQNIINLARKPFSFGPAPTTSQNDHSKYTTATDPYARPLTAE